MLRSTFGKLCLVVWCLFSYWMCFSPCLKADLPLSTKEFLTMTSPSSLGDAPQGIRQGTSSSPWGHQEPDLTEHQDAHWARQLLDCVGVSGESFFLLFVKLDNLELSGESIDRALIFRKVKKVIFSLLAREGNGKRILELGAPGPQEPPEAPSCFLS